MAGPDEIIETLVQTGRSCIYSTAMPPALAVAADRALAVIAEEPGRRERLHALIGRFTRGAQQLGLPVIPSETPIQGLIVGNAETAVGSSDYLRGARNLGERYQGAYGCEKHRAVEDKPERRPQ